MEIRISKNKLKTVLIILYVLICSFLGVFLVVDNFQISLFSSKLGLSLFYIFAGLGAILILKLLSVKIFLNNISISALIIYFGISLSFITSWKPSQDVILQFSIAIILPLLIISLSTNSIAKYISYYLYHLPTYIYEKLVGPFVLLDKFKNQFGKIKFSKDIAIEILKSVLLFTFIGLPVIFIILALLASASPSFSNIVTPFINSILNFFKIDIDFWTIVRLFFFLFFAFYFAGEISFINTFKNKVIPEFLTQIKTENFAKYVLRFVAIFLIVLNIIFGIFALADINTDLVGRIESHRENLLSKGFDSYSSYAVSRFTEIIIVTIINLLIIYFIQKYLHTESKKLSKLLKINVIILLLANLTLVFSAFQRLNLYISGYGYTEKRFDSMFTLIVITIITIVMGIYTFRNKLKEGLEIAFVIASFGIVALFILPTSYIVYNLNLNLNKNGKVVVYDPNYGINYNGCKDLDPTYEKQGLKCQEPEIDNFSKWYIKY